MKKILISALIAISCSVQAQDFLAAENDTTVLTEYNDGRLWAYRQIGDYVVGMTNYVEKDDYYRWLRGTHVQNAFSYLNASEREILISGTCSECWDNMFKEVV